MTRETHVEAVILKFFSDSAYSGSQLGAQGRESEKLAEIRRDNRILLGAFYPQRATGEGLQLALNTC